ncbi:MAG TPA: response regulator transcription factor [Pseudonocardiaceae bacterium]|jgi:DNA-binding response OmpR family regulator|nr:response regulator transcription factor [Pseudonocardiaceae bacterium]
MYEILLVEDDQSVRTALQHALTGRGFNVVPASTATDALRSVAARIPDIIILDLGLPDLDGRATLRMMRGMTNVPVIIATARSGERSIVDLLNAGADDYVVKPFSSEQLVARISALLRRCEGLTQHEDKSVLDVGGLHIDLRQRVAELDGRTLDLNRLEFDLIAYLARRRNTVVTRPELIHDVWQRQDHGDDRTIDVHVSWLRRKLGETAANPRYLHTVRGVGLKLMAPE